MFSRFASTRGFTLIELLAVMAIIGISAAIAVPRMLISVDAVSADAEQRVLMEIVDHVGLYAFLRQENHTLIFDRHAVFNQTNTLLADFDHIYFARQVITWNRNGFTDIDALAYAFRGREISLALR